MLLRVYLYSSRETDSKAKKFLSLISPAPHRNLSGEKKWSPSWSAAISLQGRVFGDSARYAVDTGR